MIPVRGVDHVLVLELRIAALRASPTHVARVDRPQRVLDRERRLEAERHRLEVARRRLLLQRVEVLPGHLQEALGRVERDPALDVRPAHVLVWRHQIELLAQVALHDGERIAGRRRSRGR